MRAIAVRLFLVCAAIAAVAIGCSSVPIERAAPLVDRLTVDDEHNSQLEAGRAIYVTRCARCHRVKPVYAYDAEQWTNKIMPRMAKWARLNAAEADSVMMYIMTARQLGPPGAPRTEL